MLVIFLSDDPEIASMAQGDTAWEEKDLLS